jgi:hypothetical protein
MLSKIIPIPSSLIVSSKNSSGSDHFVGAKSNDEISCCKLRPLIYALTGDISGPTMEKIKTYPFMGVFEKIGIEE